MSACEICGNDDATYRLCGDCLAPPIGECARALALILGGPVEDWVPIAESMVGYLNGPSR